MEISSSILNNINEKPRGYYLFIKRNIEKEKYLKGLKNLAKLKKKTEIKNAALKQRHRYAEMVQIIGPVYTLTFTKQLFEENEQGYLEEDASKECAL